MAKGTGAKAPKPRRVRYIGTLVAGLTGCEGTLVRIGRNGWRHVRFDGHASTTKCAEVNLAQI